MTHFALKFVNTAFTYTVAVALSPIFGVAEASEIPSADPPNLKLYSDKMNETFLGMALGRRMGFGERTYPLGVTLESQVSVKMQKYGACHVFAAVSSAQAACFRRTSKILPISEGYLFARHLRAEVENPKAYSFLTIDFASLFSNNDAGYYGTTLSRIEQGDVRLDSEFSMIDMGPVLNRSTATRTEFWKLPPVRQATYRDAYETRMRTELRQDIDTEINSRLFSRPTDPSVAACAPQTLRHRSVLLTPEKLVRLINAAFPVICQFHDSPPSTSSHVDVVIGYRENSLYPDKLELMTRNSNSPDLVEFGQKLNCYDAAVVYGKEEEARLEEALSI